LIIDKLFIVCKWGLKPPPSGGSLQHSEPLCRLGRQRLTRQPKGRYALNMMETMLIQQGYKYRIYPTPAQAETLRQLMGTRRFVYNHFLAKRQKHYEETGQSLSYEDCANELPALKEAFAWLKASHSQVLQQSLKDLDNAYQRFFKKQAGYPQFKRKGQRQSARYPQGVKWNVETEQTYLPKIGWIKTVFHRPIEGQVKNVTVSLTPTGKFYISFLSQREMPVPAYEGAEIGIDLGLKHFLASSTGPKVENPRHLQKAQKRLKRRQRELSRKQKGSKSRERARMRLAKAHEKVSHQRQDFLHNLSYQLVNENQVIRMETLNIKGMMQNHRLAGAIGSASWHEFIRQLEYKGKLYGCLLDFIPPFYPSSKLCSVCAYRHAELTLAERHWTCPECGTEHDRDINAAINIRNYPTAGTVGNHASGEGEAPLVSLGQTLDEARSYRL
jgi:putative transposase